VNSNKGRVKIKTFENVEIEYWILLQIFFLGVEFFKDVEIEYLLLEIRWIHEDNG
jgi:hypothetical protein